MPMKKNLLLSYFGGIRDREHGEQYIKIFRYFVPECITALILYSVPLLIDANWIAHLKSTSAYATLGITNTMLHSVLKVAEGFSVGTIIMAGQFNGIGKYKQTGIVLVNSFWTNLCAGSIVATLLYFGAHFICRFYHLPDSMIVLAVPFLKMRALGVFFTFVYFALIGFLRGIKNTRAPMHIFMLGCLVFLGCDYVLIFGKLGFPAMGLMGSAIASVIEYGFMCLIALIYILATRSLQKYEISFSLFHLSYARIRELFVLSFPVILDKAALAGAYVWLGYCLTPMGPTALASFSVIKDIERFALLPAIAFAQVITFLVSNDYGRKDWEGIKSTTKKIVFMASIGVFAILFYCSLWPKSIIQFFDFKGEFTDFAAKAFPVISVLAFLDVLQLILAGALRGAADVRVVMWTRLIICTCLLIPMTLLFSYLPIQSMLIKFVIIYSSLYFCNGAMSIVYIWRFRRESWKQKALEGV